MTRCPLLLLTMGDVAGIGPEIIARAWPDLFAFCRPVVVGDAAWMRQALQVTLSSAAVEIVSSLIDAKPSAEVIPVLQVGDVNLRDVQVGKVSAAAGKAAYEFLCRAIDETQKGRAAGIVTCPLHKEGLHAAGVLHPGHTEILAERTGSKQFAMMLYARGPRIPQGLGVIHVTLHMALRDVFQHISTVAILEKIRLLSDIMGRLCEKKPRLAVASLNPHASDGGLFGDEETRIQEPAVAAAKSEGIDVSGPLPGDTLFVRATRGEFDGIVAMYHDQGHIAMKLLSGLHAVNITVGLPLVRTSVAHGTAYDIAGQGIADAGSLIEAVRVASQLTSPIPVSPLAA